MKRRTHKYTTLFFLYFLCSLCLRGQNSNEQYYLKKDSFSARLSGLRKEFGQHKIIPAELETECLTALSFYPELKNTEIEFKFGNLNFTMISKPRFSSFLKIRTERAYVIIIQEKASNKINLDWKELSFNSLVGWIGHELGHILHYSHKSTGGIFLTGLKYAVPGYRRRMERFTDQLTIQHGLGFPLYEGIDYTIHHSQATRQYKNKQEKFYLHPEEIIARIYSKQNRVTVFRKTKMKVQESGLVKNFIAF